MTAIVQMKVRGFTRSVLVDVETGDFIYDLKEDE